MAGVIDLATYAYHIELDDKGFSDGMRQAREETDNFKGKLGDVTSFLKTAVAGALIASGIKALGQEIIETNDAIHSSLNTLQTKTGATAIEMEGLESSMMNIYNNNFGDSFEDIADTMATIKQVTGATGDELEKVSETALLMRDTFEFDVEESINTVNSLMKQFGISSEEAYTLIAQGAQNGANKNGDMLDVLNEYAPQFKALGFTSEEFMDTLIQGSEQGAFSIDKVGDAIKEFTIRSKDMSDSSAEAYEALGFDSEEMFSRFAEGGESANTAFQEVVGALESIDDPLLQNQLGVALFGTMFEDLEAGAITSLANIQSQTDMSATTLSDINQIKYDTFGEALEGIKRNLETGILVPLGESVMPILNTLAQWIMTNMPTIQKFISDAFKAAGDMLNWFSVTIMPAVFVVFDFLKNEVLPPVMALIEYITTTIVPQLAESFNKWIPVIKDILTGLWDLIVVIINKVKDILDLYLPYFQSIFEYMFSGIQIAIDVFLGVVKGIIDFLVGIFTGDWERAWQGIVDIFSSIFTGIKDTVENVVNFVSNLVGNVIDTIAGALDKINIFNNKKVEDKSVAVETSVSDLPSYDVGTPFVPDDQLALIHKGEAIIPADYNPFSGNGGSLGTSNSFSFQISLDGAQFSTRDDVDYMMDEMQFRFEQSMREVGVRG